MKSKSINIVLLPSKEVSKKSIKISKDIKRSGGIFVLDDKNFFTHISIYMLEVPIKNISKIKTALKNLTENTKPLKIIATNYRKNPTGYIDIEYKKSKNILDLQKEIIEIINPYRENILREQDKNRLASLPTPQQKILKKYGYRSIGKYFSPHITFSRIKKLENLENILLKEDMNEFSFEAKEIGLFELGENGTCVKPIKIFKLK